LGETPFRVNRETPSWFEIASFGGLGFGGNMVFKRELFARGFRFSERLGLGARLDWGEEFYAFFSIIADGHAIAYVPPAVVRHDPAPTTSARRSRLRRRSAAYLLMLWFEEKPFRRNVAAYALESLRHRRPPWRRADGGVTPANRVQMLGAALGGSILYLRSRRDA
jgi:hypothetical protein